MNEPTGKNCPNPDCFDAAMEHIYRGMGGPRGEPAKPVHDWYKCPKCGKTYEHILAYDRLVEKPFPN